VFRGYARRGAVPAPYRLDPHRTAFSAGRSGFEVAYRDYALRGPRPGAPDPGDGCAQGEFDFYVCVLVFNAVDGSTFTNVSESHSCGLTDPGPAQTIANGASMSYRVHCAVGFWGSIHYDITGQYNGGLDVTYSTFNGNYTCQFTGAVAARYTSCDPPGGSFMLPQNSRATWENWHYYFPVP
jgi:hypothetical protein